MLYAILKGCLLLCLSGYEFIITTISLELVKHAQIISSLYNEKKQVIICLVVYYSQIKCVYMVINTNSINKAWTSLTKQMVRNTSQAPFSCGNHSGYHNTSVMERIHTIGKQNSTNATYRLAFYKIIIKKGFPLCSCWNLRYLWREMTSAQSENGVLWYPLWFPHENGAWLVFLTICFVREVQALFMLFVFIYVY
jgi:hypothetical protein